MNRDLTKSVDERERQISQDMLLAFVKIADTHKRILIHSAKQSSKSASCSDVADSHANEGEEKDLD